MAVRVFWSLQLHQDIARIRSSSSSDHLLLYGFARDGSSEGDGGGDNDDAGCCAVAPAVVVAGAVAPSSADARTLAQRLRAAGAALRLRDDEVLTVLGEWRADAGGGGDGGAGGAGTGGKSSSSSSGIRAAATGSIAPSLSPPPPCWVTASGLRDYARTGAPMRCPAPPPALVRGCVRAPACVAVEWPGLGGGGGAVREVQVFVYAMPQLGRTHMPVLAAEAEHAAAALADAAAAVAAAEGGDSRTQKQQQQQQQQEQAADGSGWMGPGPGATSLEWACLCANRAPAVRWQVAGASSPPPAAVRRAGAWLEQQQQQRRQVSGRARWLDWRRAPIVAVAARVWSSIRALAASSSAGGAPWPDGCGSAAAVCRASQRSLDALCSQLLQCALGWLAAAALWRARGDLATAAARGGRALLDGAARPNIGWLLSAQPGGIKLHAELTLLYGAAASAAADAADAAYTAAWPAAAPLLAAALVAACALAGAGGGLAAAGALLRLLLAPLEAAYVCAAATYRLHLRCTRAMWRLMRGRAGAEDVAAAAAAAARLRPRQRRARSAAGGGPPLWGATDGAGGAGPRGGGGAGDDGDGGEVTLEHVIVGVLLFTPLLALLPTTLAWYLLAAALHAPALAARRALALAAGAAARNPAWALLRRAARPAACPGALCLEILQPAGAAAEEAQRRQQQDEEDGDEQQQRRPRTRRRQQQRPQQEPQRQRWFLLGCQPMGFGQVLTEAWRAPEAADGGDSGSGSGGGSGSAGLAASSLNLVRALLAGRPL